MKNTITKLAAIIFLFSCLAGSAMAADVLDTGSGARSIALGRTYTSVGSDAYGIFGNPASLNGITTGSIVDMYGQMDSDVTYLMLGYVYPTQYGNLFAGYANNGMSGLTSTTLDAITGRPAALSDFDFNNGLLILGYQNEYSGNLSYGIRAKYYTEGISTNSLVNGSGYNLDAGVLITANDQLNIGVVGKNIIQGNAGAMTLHNGQVEDMPLGLDIGLGYKTQPKLNLFADLSMTQIMPSAIKLGVEWDLMDKLALRFGAEQKASVGGSSYINGSAGVGLDLGMFGIDYAYYYDSSLVSNSTHFVSISIKTPNITSVPEQVNKEEPAAIIAPAPIVPAPAPVVVALPTPAPIVVAPPVVEKPVAPVVRHVKALKKNVYIVQQGDDLKKISMKFFGNETSFWKIARDNNIKDPDVISPGQELVINK